MKTLRSKVEVRNYAQKKVKELSEKVKEKRTFEIIELLKKNKAFLNAQKVGLYYPLKDEVNILKIMEIFKDKKYYFPKIKNENMDFRKVNDSTSLVIGKFNIKEPTSSMEIEEEIDVYLIPCLATSGNYRIGHGKGYYDRYFKRLKGYKIGIVFSELKDLNVKIDEYDIPMDIIL